MVLTDGSQSIAGGRGTLSLTGRGLYRCNFQAMGTHCEMQFPADSAESVREFCVSAIDWVDAFEAKYSRFRGDSLISEINAAAGNHAVAIDPECEYMLDLCAQLNGMTGGLFDPTTLPLIRLWYPGQDRHEMPTDDEIESARRLTGWARVVRESGSVFLPEEGMALDFGGFGKEYAVDRVADLAVRHGLRHGLIDFGHDLRVFGHPPQAPYWHIGLEDPKRPGQCWGSVAVSDTAVASSGNYLRKIVINGRSFGHIVDPRTGYPSENGATGATVISASCMAAGILSTGAFILGPKDGLELIESFPGAAGCICTEKEIRQTRGFTNYVVAE